MRKLIVLAAATAAAAFGTQLAHSAPAQAAPRIETAPCSVNGVTRADEDVAKQLSSKLKQGLDAYQVSCARAVVDQVKQRGMDERAATIAVATTMVEGNIHNYTRAVDYDSLGLFQQRPSAGWGTAAQITDPAHATDAFLNRMQKHYPNDAWKDEPIGDVAQRVQVSAFPDRYQTQATQAATIVSGLWG